MAEEKEIKTTETTETKATCTTKSSILKSLWGAIVGAAIAVGAMFGINYESVEKEKAQIVEIETKAKEALEALKAKDYETAKIKINEAISIGKEVYSDVEEVAEKVKNAKEEEVRQAAIDGAKKAMEEQKKEKESGGTGNSTK